MPSSGLLLNVTEAWEFCDCQNDTTVYNLLRLVRGGLLAITGPFHREELAPISEFDVLFFCSTFARGVVHWLEKRSINISPAKQPNWIVRWDEAQECYAKFRNANARELSHSFQNALINTSVLPASRFDAFYASSILLNGIDLDLPLKEALSGERQTFPEPGWG